MRKLNLNSVGFAAMGRTLIKNNRAQRPNKEKDISLYAPSKPWIDPVQSSPEVLQQIREKVTISRKRTHKKRLLIWGIICLVLIALFIYSEAPQKIW